MMDSMNHLMKELSKLVLEDNKCISYTYISVKFRLHVKQAIELLDQFVSEQRKNGKHLCLNYLLSGNNDTKNDDKETKMERFMILEESEVESATEWFHNGVNKHIYSVSLTEDNHSIDLNINEYEGDVKDQNYINDLQNLTYIKNPNINLRTTRRRTGIKPTVDIKEEKKDEEKKSSLNGKQVVENKSKPKNNTKGKGKQKNKISNMFSKNKTVEKEEKESTEATNESDDPFKSDSEEETKPEVKDEDMNGNDSAEEAVIEDEPKVNTKKRHSKNESNDSSDEEIIKTKKRDKKYKRVRLISDSDSDEPKESAIDKFVKTRELNQKPVKKMEKKQETHVDEDGYLVTKTVTKEVEVNTESDAKPVVNKEKPKPIKEDKIVEKKSKPKPINDKKNKNQSSITSFFKPKQLST